MTSENETESKLLETHTTDLTLLSAHEGIALWSEDKKAEFVSTFDGRVRVARAILLMTAREIALTAHRRKFIGDRHLHTLWPNERHLQHNDGVLLGGLYDDVAGTSGAGQRVPYCAPCYKIGGRELADLESLAKQRADDVLKALPPLQEAVKIIDPETAKMLDEIDVLKGKGQKLKEELDEVSEPIFMEELDQKMTIGDFRKLVKQKDTHRKKLLEELKEVGNRGSNLEVITSKKLFKGLPGLAEAVMDVVKQHLERASALDTMNRRVSEQVKFGDSEEALELLRHFEADETKVSGKVKQSFDEALARLKLAVKKGRVTKKSLIGKS